jgi:hypothetical protein
VVVGQKHQVSTFEQTSYRTEESNPDVPFFCVSFALDGSSSVEVIRIESPNVTEVYQRMEQRFPTAYESMRISAIVESRTPDDAK